MKIARKDVSIAQAAGAGTVVLGLITATELNPTMYNRRTNNCASHCSQVLNGAGLYPPNVTSRSPRYLYEWLKKQK